MSSYKQQLKQGKKVEKEHYPTYRKMLAYHKKTGQCLSKEKFAEDIAKDHLKESKNYYSKLQKAKL